MSAPSKVFNHVTKPVSVNEFRDAILSICKPRYPAARQAKPHPVCLAISGGVDSMALAVLFTKLQKTWTKMHIADNPLHASMYGLVVDHKMRPGSDQEARQVSKWLYALDIKPEIIQLRWQPNGISGIETSARALRYQAIGHLMRRGLTSLFLAHHEDDQYETILMRLLGGQGYRGLTGIRPANDIPECYHAHGVYRSGLLDSLASRYPLVEFQPSKSRLELLREDLKLDMSLDTWPTTEGDASIDDLDQHTRIIEGIRKHRGTQYGGPFLTPVPCEEGGVMCYRPLLEFSKDRLRATCEAEGVAWVEDATNKDPTLTTRNAIRYMTEHHKLPKALSKPAILALADRSRKRVAYEEAQAQRLMVRQATIKVFDPNVGTLLVTMPSFGNRKSYRRTRYTTAREQTRKARQKQVAANIIRKLIEYVTPDSHATPIPSILRIVPELFPELADTAHRHPRVAQTLAGTFFQPIPRSSGNDWFLSRLPFPSGRPRPQIVLPAKSGRSIRFNGKTGFKGVERVLESKWRGYVLLTNWDGRYWITVAGHRNHGGFKVAPLEIDNIKSFKEALPPEKRRRLDEVLRYHAPGKIRSTIPAIYALEHEEGDDVEPGTGSEWRLQYHAELQAKEAGLPPPTEPPPKTWTERLVALPTLDFVLPEWEDRLRWVIRYKKVDTKLLSLRAKGDKGLLWGMKPTVSKSRQLRIERLESRKGRRNTGRKKAQTRSICSSKLTRGRFAKS